MSFRYKKVLVVGATSGIGEGLAERLIAEGSKVIVTGRRKENLEAFVNKHRDDATSVQLDITKLDQIPSIASDIITTHPDLDCVLLNAGIQRGLNFRDPASIDLDAVEAELTTNYLSYLHLVKAFLPSLLSKKDETAVVFVSSGLAIVPLVRCPNYCASKAALHHLAMAMREQLKDTLVKVIELLPPAVQTELHDAKHQPDIKDGRSIGIPLDQFIEDTYQALARGDVEIPVGTAKAWFDAVEPTRREKFRQLVEWTS